eukprot:scaffold279_cov369-Prasinococcus_capsulatus_cf.AAC.6
MHARVRSEDASQWLHERRRPRHLVDHVDRAARRQRREVGRMVESPPAMQQREPPRVEQEALPLAHKALVAAPDARTRRVLCWSLAASVSARGGSTSPVDCTTTASNRSGEAALGWLTTRSLSRSPLRPKPTSASSSDARCCARSRGASSKVVASHRSAGLASLPSA